MASFIWHRDIEEAWDEPYEYDGQKQFHREAKNVLLAIKTHFADKDMRFDRDEISFEKAIWLLQVDALEALIDALHLIEEKKHRIASRLFRDAVETMDISYYFHLAGNNAKNHLDKWYKNGVISHSIFRNYIKKFECEKRAIELCEEYNVLSKYTHRTHGAIIKSYLLGRNNKIAYDGFANSNYKVLPQVISLSYAIIAKLINRFIEILVCTLQIDSNSIQSILDSAFELVEVPRRFGTGDGQLRRIAPTA